MKRIKSWLQRNAYGRLTSRVGLAVGAAAVSIGLSYLPYDTILQAIWVICSSMFMGTLVLKQRLNETDERRYSRLVRSRFNYLVNNDPEALNTIMADNIRPRAVAWIGKEMDLDASQVKSIDALDSLACNGDEPGRLLLRVGIKLGRWVDSDSQSEQSIERLEREVQNFVKSNRHLLGQEVHKGVFFRRIKSGEPLPTGIHLFTPESKLLLSVKEYSNGDDPRRYSLSLSAKAELFESGAGLNWDRFKEQVWEAFPEFQPVQGGSGPQKASIPFFVGPVVDQLPANEVLQSRLEVIAGEIIVDEPSEVESDPGGINPHSSDDPDSVEQERPPS